MSTRIVVCIDLVPDDLELAYCDLYKALTKSGLDWESSDEWYRCDGSLVPDDVVTESRMSGYARLKL